MQPSPSAQPRHGGAFYHSRTSLATLVQQLLSQNHWNGIDGVQTIWNFTFSGGYILPGHVKAYYLDAAAVRVDLIVTEAMLVGQFQLQVIPAVPASASRFVIYRDTPKDLPLVDFEDGARVTGANLDRAAKQAVFVAAEVLDGASVSGSSTSIILQRLSTVELQVGDTSEFGFKGLKRNIYNGPSNVSIADNGKAHYKTDGSVVAVTGANLPIEFMTTIVNNSASNMTVTPSQMTYFQDGTGNSVSVAFTIQPRGTATLVKVDGTEWLVSGTVTA